MKCLSVLGGCTVDDIKESIDFWMSDRAGDCSTFLDSLDVEEAKVLKCSAHLILGVDHALEKVLKQFEQRIGVHKLLDLGAGDRVFSGSQSVHCFGLMALSKLLSTSHGSSPVSLYNEFKQWQEDRGGNSSHFKGFVSNRFGRIAELSRELTKKRSYV